MTRKNITFLLVIGILLVLAFAPVTQAFSGAGSGTEEYPYIITNVNELQEMNDDLDAWYELGNDIDASDTLNWNGGVGFEPIGHPYCDDPACITEWRCESSSYCGSTWYDIKFTGHFDGKRYTITGLHIDRPYTAYVGLFGYVGGAEIKNVVLIDCNIVGCACVGGLVGYISSLGSTVVNNCHFTGDVRGTSNCSDSDINSSIGGLVGLLGKHSSVTSCYSQGTVDGRWFVGGLVGQASGDSTGHCTISNSYSMSNVISDTGMVGGLVGGGNDRLTNCYSTGRVSKRGGGRDAGGLQGETYSGSASKCFWDVNTSEQTTSALGAGKITAEMKQQATFTNWDFVNIWGILENATYPFIKGTPDEPQPPAKKRLIIDTDPAMGDSDPDDITAIIYAFQSPELCTVEGITYGYGNFGDQIPNPNPPDPENTRGDDRMLDYYLLQLSKMLEVLRDEAGAIEDYPDDILHRGHKESETWDNNPNPPSNSAVEFIRDTVRDNPGQISVIALGTLTNIATAIASYPDGSGSDPNGFMRDCKELWWIGGNFLDPLDPRTFNFAAPPIDPYNLGRDKKAAAYVFSNAIVGNDGKPKIKMLPLFAATRWLIKNSDIDSLSEISEISNRINDYLAFPLYWWTLQKNPWDNRQLDPSENELISIARNANALAGGFPPYDTIAIAIALEPDCNDFMIDTENYGIQVDETTGSITLFDDPDNSVCIIYDYDSDVMASSIVDRWKETEHHEPQENKKFIECSEAHYFVRYYDSGYKYSDLKDVTEDSDLLGQYYYHLPVGVHPYTYNVLSEDPVAMYRGRMTFDIDLPPQISVTDLKLHIYCDKKKDWYETGHRLSIYSCDPQETDGLTFWNSATEINKYVDSTHIGTLQAWRTVNLGAKGVSDLQNVVPNGQFAILLAEDNDDHPCAWFDTSKDWKAYLEITFDACPIGDISGDCQVDFTDFGILANQWLQAPGCPSADIAPDGGNGLVDISDLALLTEHWLEGTTP